MIRLISFLILGLSFFLSGCVSSANKVEEQVLVPLYPVIFIHGLGYTGDYWKDSDSLKELKKKGWDYGGDLKAKFSSSGIEVSPKLLSPAHIYTITFSSPVLAVVQQGKELSAIIDRVKKVNRSPKVILVGHSMGGLAVREYLQSSDYQNDVGGFVSVGTPHRGSNFDLEKPSLKLVPKILRDLVWDVDLKSDAVRDLRPKSIYLEGGQEVDSPEEFKSKDINLNGQEMDNIIGLNDLVRRPLPEDIIYTVVIGSGCPLIATRKQCSWSDGVVTVNSQDLNQIPDVNVTAKVYYTQKDHFGEANDSTVLIEAITEFLVPAF